VRPQRVGDCGRVTNNHVSRCNVQRIALARAAGAAAGDEPAADAWTDTASLTSEEARRPISQYLQGVMRCGGVDKHCARNGAVFPADDEGVGGGGAEGDAGRVDNAGVDMRGC
jgi:hypothetical protein